MIVIHCDRIYSSLIAVYCMDNGYVGKQSVAWKEYCMVYWLKELQESMDRYTGHLYITEILLETVLNTIQSINGPLICRKIDRSRLTFISSLFLFFFLIKHKVPFSYFSRTWPKHLHSFAISLQVVDTFLMRLLLKDVTGENVCSNTEYCKKVF